MRPRTTGISARSLDDFSDTLALLRGTTFTVKGRWKDELAENNELVDAIERRDAEAAEAAARQNMRSALEAAPAHALRRMTASA